MASGAAEPYGREGLPLDQARFRVLEVIKARPSPDTEALPLPACLDRVCAVDVLAPCDVPGFRASIMDGYALAQHHQPEPGARWTLRGRSAPGAPFSETLAPGEAIRILTGAPVPDGSNWVLPQELVHADEQTLHLHDVPSNQRWIRAADEECHAGERLLAKGERLTTADVGRLASCGVCQLQVHRQPRIGLLISGDELVAAGSERPAGSIWESNGSLLNALLGKLNQSIADQRVIADQPALLSQALLDMADHCDVVVSTGGVSAGDSDWIRTLVNDIGAVSFWKLFLKPGRPFAFGTLQGDVPFFGLPGNPVAAAVTALQLLWPALQLLEGQTEPEEFPRIQVRLATALQRRPGRPELARARLQCNPNGELLAEIKGSQASSRIGSLQNADLLLEIPADSASLAAGTELWAQLIRRPVF